MKLNDILIPLFFCLLEVGYILNSLFLHEPVNYLLRIEIFLIFFEFCLDFNFCGLVNKIRLHLPPTLLSKMDDWLI